METIRDLVPPPHIQGIKHFVDYALVDEILKSKDFRQGSHQESQPFFGDSLLTIDHDVHFERRRLQAPLFRKEALEYYEREELLPLIDKALEESKTNMDEDGVVRADLCALIRTMLARISAVTTGIDGVDTPERTDAFRTYIEQLGTGATVEWSVEDHDDVIKRILEVRAEFVKEFYGPSVERRIKIIDKFKDGEVEEEELPKDLLTLMYLHWNDNWDEELPLREATLYLVASSQTTTHALPHMMIHLHEWFQEHPEDYEKRFDRDFLKQAGHEAIRLHLPSPALLRIALKDVTLSDGTNIAEGERVACLFTPANRDKSVFGDDARSFNPYRETPNVKPWGFAFGGGEHTCIGRTLVTGLSARTDNDEGTDGTLVNIALALYKAGIEIDPSDLPTYTELSFHDSYGRFPILLTNV
ncbi:MAG: cytochrome P450 [Acidimicrobiales bacterium]|nr:cytochrome P450 [Acidimicrobiales bacterium]HJM28216.1 cytochrome P450 [Acidimicrobiales bacterium]